MVKNRERERERKNDDAIMAIKYDNVQNPLARFAKSAPQTYWGGGKRVDEPDPK